MALRPKRVTEAAKLINQGRRVIGDIEGPLYDELPRLSLATAYLRAALDELEQAKSDWVTLSRSLEAHRD